MCKSPSLNKINSSTLYKIYNINIYKQRLHNVTHYCTNKTVAHTNNFIILYTIRPYAFFIYNYFLKKV